MQKFPWFVLSVLCCVGLLNSCGTSSAPSSLPKDVLPSGWSIDFALGTVHLPDDPQQPQRSAVVQQQLWHHLFGPSGAGAPHAQGVSTQDTMVFFQFQDQQKMPSGPVSMVDFSNNVSQTLLEPGQFWTLKRYASAPGTAPLKWTLHYQGKQATLTRALDRNSKLPLPVFKTLKLQTRHFQASWTPVPGALSYELRIVNAQNQQVAAWVMPGSVTEMNQTLDQPIPAQSSHNVQLFAHALDITQPAVNRVLTVRQPNVSAQMKQVTSTSSPGRLVS